MEQDTSADTKLPSAESYLVTRAKDLADAYRAMRNKDIPQEVAEKVIVVLAEKDL